jgi:signal transduction histidine kinase
MKERAGRAYAGHVNPTDARFDPSRRDEIDWPWWVPLASFLVPAVTLLAAVHQRTEFGGVIRPAIFAAIAVSPFLIEAADPLTRRRLELPVEVFPIPVLIGVGLMLVTPSNMDVAPFVLVLMTAEVAARTQRKFFSLVVLAASAGLMVGLELTDQFQGSFIWVIGISFGWGGGYMIQSLLRTTTQLRLAQADLAERSAAEERQRIAREVHDVIAHSMSVTMLHITAARMALERDRTPPALEALREAEEQGRNSLRDIRRTVGLLGPDEGTTAPPMPSLADVPQLVADFRAAGLDVDLSMAGDVGSLPAAAGLNIYRIVQESLTNVVKHAPGAKAIVDLTVDGTDIHLRVHNNSGNGALHGSRSEGGLGLKGMAGRAALLGGSLAAAEEGSGWTVSLVAPVPSE